jgi:hypothetical protein
MNTLFIAIYLEGNSDVKVLPLLVQRIAQELLNNQGWSERGWRGADVSPLLILNSSLEDEPPRLSSRLTAAAHYARHCHLLILHRDADAPTTDKAKRKIVPACTEVERAQARGEQMCKTLVLLVPIRAMEAWLLVDAQALREILEVSLSDEKLGIPKQAHEVESCNPKARLNKIVQDAAPGTNLNDIYEPLAEAIRLEKLKPLRGYQEFEKDLRDAFINLGILAPGTGEE